MKKETIKFKFQCLACLALTQIETKRPKRFKPLVVATGVCHDCQSESDLRILFVPDGMKVSTTEMRLTYEGREAFYVNNPEADPDLVASSKI